MTTVSLGMFLVSWLSKNNIVNAYGLPGAAISGLNNAFWDDRMCLSNMSNCSGGILVPEPTKTLISRVKYHNVSSEANSAFIAARNPISYIMTTSGPGITNALNGIVEAYVEGYPLLTIHGIVNTNTGGFQELDISILDPISNYMFIISDMIPLNTVHNNTFNESQMSIIISELKNIINVLHYGTHDKRTSRTACIIVPSNYWDIKCKQIYNEYIAINTISPISAVNKTLSLLSISKKPVIVTGPQMQIEGSYLVLRDILNIIRIPIVSSFAGRGIIDEFNPLSLGLGGGLGSNIANYSTINSDLIIFIGTDNIGGSLSKFTDIMVNDSSTKIFINSSNEETYIDNIYMYPVDTYSYLKHMYITLSKYNIPTYENWISELKNKTYNEIVPYNTNIFSSPNVIKHIYKYIESDDTNICVLDVGNTWYYASQLYRFSNPYSIYTTSKYSSIGGSLGYTCGIYDSNTSKNGDTIYTIVGDGGFYCYYGAMLDLAHRMRESKKYIKIILIDDSIYSAVYTGDMVKYGVSTTHVLTSAFTPINMRSCIEGLGIKYYLCNSYTDIDSYMSIQESSFVHIKCKLSFVLIHPNNESYRNYLNSTSGEKVEYIYA